MKSIPLTRGFVALVDDEDYDRVAALRWCAFTPQTSNTAYALRGFRRDGRQVAELMHRFILSTPPGVEVDHINGDGLDNRRSNLRLCSRAENSRHRRKYGNGASRFKGVVPIKPDRWTRTRPFVARICVGGRRISLGCHRTEEDAARAYDAAARKHHGEFASLNFPEVSCGV